MYDSSSYETKFFFHPGFLGFKKMRPSWFFLQLGLIFSTFRICKRLLTYAFPQLVFVPILATDVQNQVIGFAYIKVKKKLQNGFFIGELGISVEDKHQNKGVGAKLLSQIISLAEREHFSKIELTVSPCNLKAIHLYRKYGFVQCGILLNGDRWNGLVFDSVAMALYLNGKNIDRKCD